MELLYVWIEKYNNIHHQGFNFSPKYKFEFTPTTFDEKGKVTEGTLTHDDINPNYPDNFFGEHISNITAIVGKNGSGKSSLIKTIFESYLGLKKYFVIFFDDTIFRYNTNLPIQELKYSNECKDNKLKIHYGSNSDFYTRLIYSSLYINSNKNKTINLHKGDISSRARFEYAINNTIQNYCNSKTNINSYTNTIPQNIFYSFSAKEMATQIRFVCELNSEELVPFKLPSIIELSFPYIANYKEGDKIDITYLIYKAINEKHLLEPEYKNTTEESLQPTYEEIDSMRLLKELCKERNLEIEKIDLLRTFLDKREAIIEDNAYKKMINYSLNSEDVLKLGVFANKENIDDFDFWCKNKWIEDLGLELKWRDLSDGETSLLTVMARLWEKQQHENQASIILLDEFDFGLHPQWQKESISLLIALFNLLESRGHHLILTTHSPILVSDLPRENIIFLDKDAEGNSVVKEPKDMQRTFGANIHNLYRSSFFMQDGLMGKFAKEKIDGVIRDLRGDGEIEEKRKTEIRFIIDTIGEDVLRTGLEKLYEGRFPLSDKERLEKEFIHLEKKKAEVEQKLKALN